MKGPDKFATQTEIKLYNNYSQREKFSDEATEVGSDTKERHVNASQNKITLEVLKDIH